MTKKLFIVEQDAIRTFHVWAWSQEDAFDVANEYGDDVRWETDETRAYEETSAATIERLKAKAKRGRFSYDEQIVNPHDAPEDA